MIPHLEIEMKTFEELGGRKILEKGTKLFYGKVYAHPWLGRFFKDVPQEIIEGQQIDFLQGALGGKKVYCGRLPIPTHTHMFITDEVFDLRSEILVEALQEVQACNELIERILKVDQAFRGGIVKKTVGDCEKRYFTDELMIITKPS